MQSKSVTNKEVYETVLPDGSIFGHLGARDIKRFESTEKYIIREAQSILDVGCFCGEWLNFLLQKRKGIQKHLGIDVAQNKIEKARRLHPHLNVETSFAENLKVSYGSFDVVTCLEVLEHIPEWDSVFRSLFRFASKQVVITVPYNENIINTVCVHCGKLTPLYGHLHSYSEESLPDVPGWSRTFQKIPDRNPAKSFLYRLYRRLFKPSWLLVNYQKTII
jgi:ubiquinone/menaquinone biosynthesis C-methylase UbiE